MALLKARPGLHLTELPEGAVIIDMEYGRIMELNRTATLLWKVMSESSNLSEALDALERRVDENRETLITHLLEFRDNLELEGLLLPNQSDLCE